VNIVCRRAASASCSFLSKGYSLTDTNSFVSSSIEVYGNMQIVGLWASAVWTTNDPGPLHK
jgi:hypothetical protein